MEHPTITIAICPEHKQRMEQMAEFFGYADIEHLASDMLTQEFSRVEERMYADLFRMHHDDLLEIIRARERREDQNHLN